MPERARVTSLEALEAFRASLVVYLSKAGRALDEVGDEVVRTRLWVQADRRAHWEQEVRRRAKVLEDKQQEFFRARMATLPQATQAEQAAVFRARRALEEAQDRLAAVRKWSRQYESRVEPLAREVDRLRDFLTGHMGKAVVYLDQAIRTLRAYAEQTAPDRSATAAATGTRPGAELPSAPPDPGRSS